jgi:hypothetical protein
MHHACGITFKFREILHFRENFGEISSSRENCRFRMIFACSRKLKNAYFRFLEENRISKKTVKNYRLLILTEKKVGTHA